MHVKTTVHGFEGYCVYTKGTVTLQTIFGEAPAQMICVVKFLVIDRPSAYNAIIICPILNALRVITCTYHLVMKFSIEFGFEVILGSQVMARECYVMAMSPKVVDTRLDVSTIFMIDDIELPTQGDLIMLRDLDPHGQTEKTVKKVVEISIGPDNPKKTVKIGTCMPPELRES